MKFQAEIIHGEEVTADHYQEMLGVLPPERMVCNAFLVGEPVDHVGGRARYDLYFERDGKFFSGGLATTKYFDMFLIP